MGSGAAAAAAAARFDDDSGRAEDVWTRLDDSARGADSGLDEVGGRLGVRTDWDRIGTSAVPPADSVADILQKALCDQARGEEGEAERMGRGGERGREKGGSGQGMQV